MGLKQQLGRIASSLMPRLLFCIPLSLGAAPSTAVSATVLAQFTGYVGSVNDPGGTLNGVVAQGDLYTGVISLITDAKDCSGTYDCYYSGSVDQGSSFSFESGLVLSPIWGLSRVVNDAPVAGDVGDHVFFAGSTGISSPLGASTLTAKVYDHTGTFLTSGDLDLGPQYGLLVAPPYPYPEDVINGSGIGISGSDYSISLRFTSFELSTTPVPLPAAAWLLSVGLIGLLPFRRRKAS